MKTKREFRNDLGDDISWKTLYAVQNKVYESREAALLDAIRLVSGIDEKKLMKLMQGDGFRLEFADVTDKGWSK